MRRRARVVVSGRVQGVWFREATRRRAEELGVAGWVRNLPDGRVEAVFEGASAAVEAAVAFVRHGPPLARVDEASVEEQSDLAGEPPGGSRFEVRG